ncbi:ABC transporter permease [Devosia sp.]|uniref:ABC transporter permease n=1 Tax=Devosia sp. TaxID=1871048 RepID=UPI0035AECE7A
MARAGEATAPTASRSLIWLLVLPMAAIHAVAFLWPIVNLLLLSFRPTGAGGVILPGWSLQSWWDVLSDRFYLQMLFRSIWLSLLITAITLVASYPIALFLHRMPPRWRPVLLVVCISPLLLSAVVRTYGWLVILGDGGFVASIMRSIGLTPPRMLFNPTGVVIGLVEILMPYMILSLYAGFGRLSASLEEAAKSLGARPLTVLWRIVIPLTLPGVFLGCLLTFVLAISSFITPKILGGGRVILLATEIYDQAVITLNWSVAGVLSLIALLIFGGSLATYSRVSRTQE